MFWSRPSFTAALNNIAELLAVKEALVWATEHGYEAIEIRTDSRNNLAWVAGRIGKKLNDSGRGAGPLQQNQSPHQVQTDSGRRETGHICGTSVESSGIDSVKPERYGSPTPTGGLGGSPQIPDQRS